jgi:excisionase family DNA binding protein
MFEIHLNEGDRLLLRGISDALAQLRDKIDSVNTSHTAVAGTIMNVRGAAKALGINEMTIRRGIDAGILPSFRVGRVIRVDINELRAVLRRKDVRQHEI